MAQTTCLLVVLVSACFTAKISGVRGSRFLQRPIPKIDIRTLSLRGDTIFNSDSECTLGFAGDKIGPDAFDSSTYALDKSRFQNVEETYGQHREAKQILKDLSDNVNLSKQYFLVLNWVLPWNPDARFIEFEVQAEAAELGVAPVLVAGWVCHVTPHGDADYLVSVMERAEVSLKTFYNHLCSELTEENRVETTRLAALAQRAAVGVLEQLARVGIEHSGAYNEYFMLNAEGRVRGTNFEFANVDKQVDEGHETRKLLIFKRSLPSLWLSTKYDLQCLRREWEALEDARFLRVGRREVVVGSPQDPELKLLDLVTFASGLQTPYSWDTFRPFVDVSVAREPLVVELLASPVVVDDN